ncbi:hypothetical protein TNCV_984101 [Trichonephila clavipes]|nr:hypothetical protein TNCV_984101 [Trichonephila clavipes]
MDHYEKIDIVHIHQRGVHKTFLTPLQGYGSSNDCCNADLLPGNLGVRAWDSRPKGLDSMPDATKYPPSAHGVRAR